jgi:hypothetical protein
MRISVIILLFMIVSCGKEKNTSSPVVDSIDKKQVSTPKEYKYQKSIIDFFENKNVSPSGATGFSVLVVENKILIYKEEALFLDEELDDSIFVNINRKGERQSLGFKMIDFIEGEFIYNDKMFSVVELDYNFTNDIINIQIGQYSHLQKKTTWSVIVSKNYIQKEI